MKNEIWVSGFWQISFNTKKYKSTVIPIIKIIEYMRPTSVNVRLTNLDINKGKRRLYKN